MNLKMELTGAELISHSILDVNNPLLVNKQYGNIFGNFIKIRNLLISNHQAEKGKILTIRFVHLRIVTGETIKYLVE
jgi:hypothetical protein